VSEKPGAVHIVVAVADAADRGLDAGIRKPFGIADRDILHAAIAVVDETAFVHGTPVVKRLLERIQDEVRPCRTRHAPADDAPGERIDHEGDVDEAGPGRDVGEVRYPEHVRLRCPELPVDPVERTWRRWIADRGPDSLAANGAFDPHLPHEPCEVQRATSNPSRASCRQILRTP